MTVAGHCPECGKGFRPSDARRRYCSRECAAAADRRKWQRHTPKLGIAPNSVGAVSELLAAADLLARGYHVFRSLSPSSACDLVAINPNGGAIIRLEVRTGARTKMGDVRFPRKREDVGRSDHYAVVVQGEDVIIYDPPLPREGG